MLNTLKKNPSKDLPHWLLELEHVFGISVKILRLSFSIPFPNKVGIGAAPNSCQAARKVMKTQQLCTWGLDYSLHKVWRQRLE